MAAAALSSVDHDDFRSLSRQPERDPDIQATLSDFLTYTEHFPAHLTRALTLIQDQREKAERGIKAVHDDTTAYSILPSIKHDRPDPVQLRRDISYALAEAESACRMSVEEAVRLDKECQREAKRLDIVTDKLEAQPLPPSRDPTPEQTGLTSPNLKRERRMSTRAEEAQADKQHPSRVHDKAASKAASKLRGRKVMVPGEVLPPPDPNAPPDFTSDWDSPRTTPPLAEEHLSVLGADREKKDKKGTTPRPRSHTPRPPRTEEERECDRQNPKPRGPRAPGQPGTNAHSAVAGISTSNALLALTEPPPDARPGSKWLPWVKLTEWEMAKLRKRMKKNAIWVPSQTMVRRELKNLGRGIQGKEAARANAERGGEPFVDEGIGGDPTKVIISGEESAQMTAMLGPQIYADDEDADAELINRGMRLNEAKKLKRQRLLEEQALQAQIARETGVDPATGGKDISGSPDADKKKRKRDTSPTAGPSVEIGGENKRPALKKIKIAPPKTMQVPLAPAGPTSSSRDRAATPPAGWKTTITIKPSKAVSEEPPNRRSSSRRVSNASVPGDSNASVDSAEAGPSTTKSGRRSRRPAHNVVITSHDDEDAKVGISKRKAAPKKKKKDSVAPPDQPGSAPANDTGEDYIDPQEPRYCICGDVSWGTMIACDNDDCEKEWFHLDCVDLTGMPPRRTKWYCPDCRKKLKLGTGTNGLVGRNLGPQGSGR